MKGAAPQHLPGGGGRLARRIRLHPPAAGRVKAAEWQFDAALVLARAALDDRPIGLADAARLEQPAKLGQRLAVAPQHQAARRVAVEPVGERRGARQPVAQRAEIILQALTALGSAMHRHAGRLVDDQHQPVAVEHAGHHVFRCHGSIRHWSHFRRQAGTHPGSRPGHALPENAPTAITAPIMNEARPSGGTWWQRLSSGLKRTSASIGGAITDLVAKRKLDAATIDELEEVLIRADLGPATAGRIADAIRAGRYDKAVTPDEVKGILAAEVEKVLAPVAAPLFVDGAKPFVVLVAGVNGSGKTTTIGKLAARYRAEGRKVVLAAGDTFRAAAIDQLKIWGARTGAEIVAREPGADAAGLAFDALSAAKDKGADVLLIDTAGRLQNKAALMGELEKVVRVLKKLDPTAPHAVLLVLDATVGQNALSQVEEFSRIAGVTGLAMTKLDGSARGGILVAIAEKHRLPIHFIGVGEGVDDLAPFQAREFAKAIAGLET